MNNCLSLMSSGNTDRDSSLSDKGPFYSYFLTEESKEARCFSNFLQDHISVGFERGFVDNINKHAPSMRDIHFELAGLGEWLEAADKAQLRIEQQLRVHILFLNMWDVLLNLLLFCLVKIRSPHICFCIHL